jgi:uncharacterized membrane protein
MVLVALVAAGVVIDSSRLFLAQRSLASLADGAALRAAHDLDLAALYSAQPAGALPLSERAVTADVAAYVSAQANANGAGDVRVVGVHTDGAGTVTVTLQRDERVPLMAAVLGRTGAATVTATATARTQVVDGAAVERPPGTGLPIGPTGSG